jgi:hypothetical protein
MNGTVEVMLMRLDTPHPHQQERRTAVRQRCCEETLSVVVFDGRESRWARAEDISRTGISLAVCGPYVAGASLSLCLRSRPGRVVLERVVGVVHARQQADGIWSIGCAFEEPLSQEELQILV